MNAHAFDTAIALQPLAEHAFAGHTSPAYANFIGPYGGITAAQCLHAVLRHPQRLGDPVAFTVNFAAGRRRRRLRGPAARRAHQPVHAALDHRDGAGRGSGRHRHRADRRAPPDLG
jgi:hypothetical protein